MSRYIRQLPAWPRFHWHQEVLVAPLAAVRHKQGRLLGRMEALGGHVFRRNRIEADMAEEMRLRDAAPKPLLQGRHLVARGMAPGERFGTLLSEAFEAQLEGAFADLEGALKWLDEHA